MWLLVAMRLLLYSTVAWKLLHQLCLELAALISGIKQLTFYASHSTGRCV